MQQRLIVWCFAICIIAVLYVWTCAQSTPQNSFGELASAIKQSNSGKFDELVDQSEIALAASKDIIPDQMTKQAGPAGVSFAQYRMLLYQNIASQISALGKVSTPESAQGGYKFVKDESITQPAQQ